MLQLHALNRSILDDPGFRLAIAPAAGEEAEAATGSGLERRADRAIDRFRAERLQRARNAGGISRLAATIDAALRTDAIEHMDEPSYPERGKLAIALGLHLMNVASASYRRFFTLLQPMLREIQEREGRPARVLELASGSGGFAFALASLAKRRGVAIEVTASDVVPLYVSRGREKAAASRIPVSFRLLDALNMSAVDDGAYDIIFIAQSVHHFSPGQLARMIAESRRVAATAFVSVDGYRSLPMVAFVAGTAVMSLWPAMVHDAVISVRKFYGEAELEAIARMAAPDGRITIGRIRPLNTTLTVSFGERPAP
jgi:SAM-dependent methyltransferase